MVRDESKRSRILLQRGLLVQVYDNLTLAEWETSQNDVPFYLAEARIAAGPLLELGCGTGRLLIPLLSTGFEVSGLDASGDLQKRILTAH